MDGVKLKATVMWANLNKVNTLSNKYQVNLCNLSDAATEALEAIGISVNEKEGMGKYIVCKSENVIRAFNTDNDEITERGIGNGSKAKALVTTYEWKFKNKKGLSPSVKKLIITDLVEYAGAGGGSLKDDDEVL